MKRSIIMILLTGLCILNLLMSSINAQKTIIKVDNSIQLSSRSESILSTFDKTRDIPLLNSNSNIVGSYRPEIVQEEKKFRVVIPNGSNFLVDPMQFTILSSDQNRLLVYGDFFELCTFSKLFLKIYSGEGDVIKSFDSGLYWPYALAMDNNGDIVIVGKNGYDSLTFVLRKYSSEGDLLWEIPLSSDSPMRLVLSPNNQFSSLIQYNEDTRIRSLLIFDDAGNRVYQNKLPNPVSSMEFITDDKLVVYSGYEWFLYKINNEIELIANHQFNGNPLGNHPISGSPDGELFLIATSTTQGDGFQLQVYNSSEGKFIAENYYSGFPYWQAYRMARMIDSRNIELLTENEVVVFSLN